MTLFSYKLLTLLALLLLFIFVIWRVFISRLRVSLMELVVEIRVARAIEIISRHGALFIVNRKSDTTAVTSIHAYLLANNYETKDVLMVWPTFTFGPRNYPRRKGQTGTLEDLEGCYRRVIEGYTGYSGDTFTSAEVARISAVFTVGNDRLFVPGCGTPTENDEYRGSHGVPTIEHARCIIRV